MKFFKVFLSFLIFQFFFLSFLTLIIDIKDGMALKTDRTTEGGGMMSQGGAMEMSAMEEGSFDLGVQPIEPHIDSDMHSKQDAFKIQSLANITVNAMMMEISFLQCKAGKGEQCAMGVLFGTQVGFGIWAYMAGKDGADDTGDDNGDDPPGDDPGGNGTPPPDKGGPKGPALQLIENQTKDTMNKLRDRGWGVDPKTGEMTDPEGNKFKLDSFNPDDLAAQGFTPEAIGGLTSAYQEMSDLGDSLYDGVYSELEEQLENAEDPDNPKFNLVPMGFKSAPGGGGGSSYFGSSGRGPAGKGRPSFSSFLEKFQNKDKKDKKGKKDIKSSKYTNLFGKNRVGSSISNIFRMVSRRIETLKRKKFLKI